MLITPAIVEAFHEGGWPMFPILALGILLLVAASRYAVHAEARLLPLVRNLMGLTFVFGVLGTTLGMIHCLSAMSEVPQDLVVKISMLGLGESLNNLALALFLIVFASMLTAVGALRAAQRSQDPAQAPV
jgi:biopolymer transport protein ExbB/TolQ